MTKNWNCVWSVCGPQSNPWPNPGTFDCFFQKFKHTALPKITRCINQLWTMHFLNCTIRSVPLNARSCWKKQVFGHLVTYIFNNVARICQTFLPNLLCLRIRWAWVFLFTLTSHHTPTLISCNRISCIFCVWDYFSTNIRCCEYLRSRCKYFHLWYKSTMYRFHHCILFQTTSYKTVCSQRISIWTCFQTCSKIISVCCLKIARSRFFRHMNPMEIRSPVDYYWFFCNWNTGKTFTTI
jgi:hypothetical protein